MQQYLKEESTNSVVEREEITSRLMRGGGVVSGGNREMGVCQ